MYNGSQMAIREAIQTDPPPDPTQDDPYNVTGCRPERGRYVTVEPDARGWLHRQVIGDWIGVKQARDGVFIVEGRTGEGLRPDRERVAQAEAGRRLLEMEAAIARLREQLSGSQ